MNALHDGGDDAAAALRLIQETRRKTAIRMKAPAYYHPALGCIMGVIIASIEMHGDNYLLPIALCALVVLMHQYQKKTGVWTNGLTTGGRRSKRLMAGGLFALIAILFAGMLLNFHYGIDGAMIGAGILAALVATWLGYAWERAMLKDAGAE